MPQLVTKGILLALLLTLLLATALSAAAGTSADDLNTPGARFETPAPLAGLNLFTLNKYPLRVLTVDNCGDKADAETRFFCAIKSSVLESSPLTIYVKVKTGNAYLQSISTSGAPLHPEKNQDTAIQYAFETDGDGYNVFFIDQSTLYAYFSEQNVDVAVGIFKTLLDKQYPISLNSECRILTSSNRMAMAFKNCQLTNSNRQALDQLTVQKIDCQAPAKTGIIAVSQPVNGQCPAQIPSGNVALKPAVDTTSSGNNNPQSTDCTSDDIGYPIDNPQPRTGDSQGDYWWGASRNTAGHHEGVDVKGTVGVTPVKSVGTGTVEEYTTDACGNAVLIRHECTIDGNVFRTKYCHLDPKSKKPPVGSKVSKGQVIGLVGKTGNAESSEVPHLHIEYIAGGTFVKGKASVGGDFDPVSKGFMPSTFSAPGPNQRIATHQNFEQLDFAGTETLPTIQEYIQSTFPNAGEFKAGSYHTRNPVQFNANPCLTSNRDDDANGFFGYRMRGTAPGCVHAGIDIRGIKASIGGKPVKAMLSGTITINHAHYQSSTSNDCWIVVDSGDWVISYGHVAQDEFCKPGKIGKTVKKGEKIATISRSISPPLGNELDVKILYKGSDSDLQELTVQRLRQADTKYSKYTPFFSRYKTNQIFSGSDFTFNVGNYDQYFLWEAYTADMESKSAVTTGTPTTSTPDGTKTPTQQPTTPAHASTPATGTLSRLCVYYYLDGNDGAKDKFYDVGLAVYGGDHGACLVGRGAVSRPGITYPDGYSGLVNINQLPQADSYQGCYVANIPLAKHGNDYVSGAYARMFLSDQSITQLPPGLTYLDKGIPRKEVGTAKQIGTPSCTEPGVGKPSPAVKDTGAAGKQFLTFAQQLQGLPYCRGGRFGCHYSSDKSGKITSVDCSGLVNYAMAKMLEAGYTLPPEVYDLYKKDQVNFNGHKILTKGLKDHSLKPSEVPGVKVPAAVNLPLPHTADYQGALWEILNKKVSLDQVQPGDWVVFVDGGSQCTRRVNENGPNGPVDDSKDPCWRGWGHIGVVVSGTGSQITTIESTGRGGVRTIPNRNGIAAAFHPTWIPTGGAANPSVGKGGGKTVYIGLNHDYCVIGTATSETFEAAEIYRVSLMMKEKLQALGYNVILSKDWAKTGPGQFVSYPRGGPADASALSIKGGCTSQKDNPICRVLDITPANPCADEVGEFRANAELAKIKGASIAVAPHFDADPGKRVVFDYPQSPESVKLANAVATSLSTTVEPHTNAGKGRLDFLIQMSLVSIPAITLEMDKLDTPGVGTDQYADKMATSIVQGIVAYLGPANSGGGIPARPNKP